MLEIENVSKTFHPNTPNEVRGLRNIRLSLEEGSFTGAVMGSVLFRLMVAIALRWGLNPNDLKLITAVFVFAALILPTLLERIRESRARAANA